MTMSMFSKKPLITVFILIVQALAKLAQLMQKDGSKAIIAENLLLKHQLIVINRSRKRAPNLSSLDRVILGLSSIFINKKDHPSFFHRGSLFRVRFSPLLSILQLFDHQ